jgi:Fe-S-cluster containining protein
MNIVQGAYKAFGEMMRKEYQKIAELTENLKGACGQCGKCCKPPPVFIEEVKDIIAFVKENNITPITRNKETCIWLNHDRTCLIYKVRPLMCRIYGYDPHLPCKNFDQYQTQDWVWNRYKYRKQFYMQEIRKDYMKMLSSKRIKYKILPGGWWE